jgi:hypothetical protein
MKLFPPSSFVVRPLPPKLVLTSSKQLAQWLINCFTS